MMKSETTPAKQPPAKMPKKAQVYFSMTNGLWSVRRDITASNAIPCAVIPCRTRQQAAALVRWHKLTRDGKIDALAYSDLWKICGFKSKEVAEIILNLTEHNA